MPISNNDITVNDFYKAEKLLDELCNKDIAEGSDKSNEAVTPVMINNTIDRSMYCGEMKGIYITKGKRSFSTKKIGGGFSSIGSKLICELSYKDFNVSILIEFSLTYSTPGKGVGKLFTDIHAISGESDEDVINRIISPTSDSLAKLIIKISSK